MSILSSDMIGGNGKLYSFDADDWVCEIFNKNSNADNNKVEIIPYFGAIMQKMAERLNP